VAHLGVADTPCQNRGQAAHARKDADRSPAGNKPKEEFDDLLDASDLPQNTPDNLELIRALLDRGADPNAADPQGFTALHYAIRWQKRGTADLLLAHRADPDHGDRNRVTPLMIAVYMADPQAIRLLLDHGAHVDLQDDISGQTALMLAVTLKRPTCIAALMPHHPDLTVRDHNGKTALDYARAEKAGALLTHR
jgi:ankyrin repeat protein